jgi:hypothetical protein
MIGGVAIRLIVLEPPTEGHLVGEFACLLKNIIALRFLSNQSSRWHISQFEKVSLPGFFFVLGTTSWLLAHLFLGISLSLLWKNGTREDSKLYSYPSQLNFHCV